MKKNEDSVKTFRGKAEERFSHCLSSFHETCILSQFWEAVAWDLQPKDLTVCARYLGHHDYWLTWTWYVRPFWHVTASMNFDRIQQLYSVDCVIHFNIHIPVSLHWTSQYSPPQPPHWRSLLWSTCSSIVRHDLPLPTTSPSATSPPTTRVYEVQQGGDGNLARGNTLLSSRFLHRCHHIWGHKGLKMAILNLPSRINVLNGL